MSLHIEDMFDPQGKDKMLSRVNALSPNSKAEWGKMDVAQMLAHCNVAYEIVHESGMHSPPNFFGKLMANIFAKGIVIGPKPYAKNNPTAPIFVIEGEKDFEAEKARLIAYANKTSEQGASHYEGLNNMTFGDLTSEQWNTLFSKHLDHHLKQFGV